MRDEWRSFVGQLWEAQGVGAVNIPVADDDPCVKQFGPSIKYRHWFRPSWLYRAVGIEL